jgi:hypothetical protein
VPQPVPTHPVSTYSPPRTYISLLLGGIIILLVGGIIFISVGFIDDPEDYDEREEYNDTVRTFSTVGNLIQYVGLMVLSIGLILGSIKDESLHANVRLGMLIAMGLIVGFKIMSLIPWVTSL